MKRKATLSLLTLFFFTFVGQLNATTLKENKITKTVALPANDDCANALTLTVNSDFLCTNTTAGTLLDATATTGLSGCPGLPQNANDDVWFKFVATDTSHKIELLNIAGSNTNLYYMVFDGGTTGDCNSMTGIFCGSANPGTPTGLTVGNTYFINVFTNASTPGADTTFDICVGTTPTAAPSNDNCSGAITINFPFTETTYDATSATNNSGFITASSCIDMNDGVWYKIIGNGEVITITVVPNSWDAAIAVYDGSCGSFTCIGDRNSGGVGFAEAFVFTSTASTEYYINVGYPSGTDNQPEGVFILRATSAPLSIDDIVAKGFYYYPNPVENTLKMNANEAITEVSLYTVLGREIKKLTQTSDKSAELDLTNLPAGTYFVRVTIGEATGSFKILRN